MKLLIIDVHPMALAGVAALLKQPKYQAETLLAKDVSEGLAFIHANADIDAVLLDIGLPGEDGITALATIGDARADLPVIILSASENPADVRRALAAGALGYVPKSATIDTLISAVRLVLAGDVYVPPIVLRESPEFSADDKGPSISNLTNRQAEILNMLGCSLSNKEIARNLDLSERTVKAHVTAIFKSLRVKNRAEASRYAQSGVSDNNC